LGSIVNNIVTFRPIILLGLNKSIEIYYLMIKEEEEEEKKEVIN
jgi:hypothetical protein